MRSSYGSRVVAFATLVVSSPPTHALYSNLPGALSPGRGPRNLTYFNTMFYSCLKTIWTQHQEKKYIFGWCTKPQCSGALKQTADAPVSIQHGVAPGTCCIEMPCFLLSQVRPSETDVAPWCYKWNGLGFGWDWKSLGRTMLRAPTVLKMLKS